MDRKITKQIDLLTEVMTLVIGSKVCPDTPTQDWAKIILHAHSKGYLYVMLEEGHVIATCLAYRIPEWNEKYSDEMPHKETGNILYIGWSVSISDNAVTLLRMLKQYLRLHPEIEEIIYYRRNNEKDFKRIKVRKELVHV